MFPCSHNIYFLFKHIYAQNRLLLAYNLSCADVFFPSAAILIVFYLPKSIHMLRRSPSFVIVPAYCKFSGHLFLHASLQLNLKHAISRGESCNQNILEVRQVTLQVAKIFLQRLFALISSIIAHV